jgi:hypothetical protein
MYNAERHASGAAGSGSEARADAGGSQVQCLVRRGWAGISGPRPATCSEYGGEAHASSDLLSGTQRKAPHPYLPLCDTHHRPLL